MVDDVCPPEPEDTHILKIVLQIYKNFKKWLNELRIAIKMNDVEAMKEKFQLYEDK